MLRRTSEILFVVLVSSPVAQLRAEMVVEVTRIDGSTVQGTWSPVTDAGRIAVRTAIRQEIFSEQDLISVQFLDSFLTSQTGEWDVTVWCQDGSVFPADVRQGGGSHLVLKTPFADDVRIDLKEVAAIHWAGRAETPVDMAQQLYQRHTTKDTLVAVQDGKLRRLQGAVAGISPTGGSFTYRGKTRSFDALSAPALILAGAGRGPRPPALCVLNDGYHIAGRILSTTEDTITLEGVAEARISLPVPTVQRITFSSDRLIYLSDLEPAESRQRSTFDVPWPVRFDRAVSNRPMSMHDRRYAKGIGVHARCELIFDLDGDFRSLAATVGIDDYTRPAGHVVFRVLVDGEERFSSGPVTGRDEPRNIVVPVSGARRITLIVDEAEELDIGDHANWANVRLIK